MIKLLTFDLDNTLWPVDQVIERAIEIKFKWLKANYPVITEKISSQRFLAIRDQLLKKHPQLLADLTLLRTLTIEHAALEAGISSAEAKTLARKAFDIFFEERNKVQLFPNAQNMLETLSKSYHLIALTNGNADLNIIGLDHYFHAHYKPIDVGKPKPEPEMFQLALKKLNLKAEQSIHIGDDFICDVQAAKQLGMKSIWANILKLEHPECEQEADATVTCLSELPKAIESLS